MEKKNHLSAASVILAGVLWGVISLFIKTMSAYGLDAMQIATLRLIVAAACFTVFVLIKDPKLLKFRLKDIWMFLGTGVVSVVLFNMTYFYTMIHSQASVAVVLLYTSPVFVMIISAILFKEKITFQKITALVMTFLGCVFVAGMIGGEMNVRPFILFTGISAGLLYALYTIFGRFALEKYDTITVTAYTFIFGTLGSIPFGRVIPAAKIIFAHWELVLLCIGIGVISTVLPYFFYTWGLERMESGKAAILVAVEPLVGAVVGITVFHESISVSKIIGIALIIGAIVVMNVEINPKLLQKNT